MQHKVSVFLRRFFFFLFSLSLLDWYHEMDWFVFYYSVSFMALSHVVFSSGKGEKSKWGEKEMGFMCVCVCVWVYL